MRRVTTRANVGHSTRCRPVRSAKLYAVRLLIPRGRRAREHGRANPRSEKGRPRRARSAFRRPLCAAGTDRGLGHRHQRNGSDVDVDPHIDVDIERGGRDRLDHHHVGVDRLHHVGHIDVDHDRQREHDHHRAGVVGLLVDHDHHDGIDHDRFEHHDEFTHDRFEHHDDLTHHRFEHHDDLTHHRFDHHDDLTHDHRLHRGTEHDIHLVRIIVDDRPVRLDQLHHRLDRLDRSDVDDVGQHLDHRTHVLVDILVDIHSGFR